VVANAGVGGSGGNDPDGRGRGRGRLHFWVIQVTELAVAVGLVDLSLHVTRAAVLLGAAGVLAAISLTAKGPLGVVRLVGRPAHRVVALVVAAGMALAPLAPALRPGVDGIAILELGAIGLARVATLVRVAPGPLSADPEAPGRRAARGEPSGASPGSRGGADPPPVARAARWAGRAASQAGTAVNRAADSHGPVAKAHVLRVARTSGRVTGWLTAQRRRRSPRGPGN